MKVIFLKKNLKKIIHKIALNLILGLVFQEKKQIKEAQIKKNLLIDNIKILARVIHKLPTPPEKEEYNVLYTNFIINKNYIYKFNKILLV